MMKSGFLILWLVGATAEPLAPHGTGLESEQALMKEIAESGRCADLSQDPDTRVSPRSMVAPGPPPALSFRYYEGRLHHGFENTDLMLDDAGH
jgi:hypothetical protein